jgi:hypothetical protein
LNAPLSNDRAWFMWLRLAPRRRILAKQRSMCSSPTALNFRSPITGVIQFRRMPS